MPAQDREVLAELDALFGVFDGHGQNGRDLVVRA
jgi:hypothetical protein